MQSRISSSESQAFHLNYQNQKYGNKCINRWMFQSIDFPLQAKELLQRVLDDYIQEKVLLADEAISQSCMKVINDGDVILVHAQYVTKHVHQHTHLQRSHLSLQFFNCSKVSHRCT